SNEIIEIRAAERTASGTGASANLLEIKTRVRCNTAGKRFAAIGRQRASRKTTQDVRYDGAVSGSVVGRLRTTGQIALEPRNAPVHGRRRRIDTGIQDADIDALPREALALRGQRAGRNEVVVRRIVGRWWRRWWWWWRWRWRWRRRRRWRWRWRWRRRRWRWRRRTRRRWSRRAGLHHAAAPTPTTGSQINGCGRDDAGRDGQR